MDVVVVVVVEVVVSIIIVVEESFVDVFVVSVAAADAVVVGKFLNF